MSFMEDAQDRMKAMREEADEKLAKAAAEKGPNEDGEIVSDDGQVHGRSWSNSSEHIETN